MKNLIRQLRRGALLLALLLSAGNGLFAATPGSPRYIFLFIGDGMGIPQLTLAGHATGKEITAGFPAIGVTTTSSLDHFITDSAAAATALACGEKTNSGTIGRRPDGTPLRSFVETAKKQGRKIGIVTSVSLNHATPAGFYARVPNRNDYYEIALQMGQSNIDFFGGGGVLQPRGRDGKQPDALELARANGYRVVDTLEEFNALRPGSGKTIAVTPDPTPEQSFPYAIDRVLGQLSLRGLTEKATELLDNPDGFFLMVEGGMIDWACHANDAATALAETVALREAVDVAFEFAAKHPGETLIIVTADHETGGMTLGHRRIPYKENYRLLTGQRHSFQTFSRLLADQKQKDNFDWEAVKKLIAGNFNLKFEGNPEDPALLTAADVARLRNAWQLSASGDRRTIEHEYGGYDPLAVTACAILAEKAGIGWSTFAHTALPVMTAAYGPGAEKFSNRLDNTDIARRIEEQL